MRWLLIDQILDCKPAISAVGKKTFATSESFFLDHFPGFPIVPGVLQIEMIAQLAGKCIAMQDTEILPVLGTVKAAKFFHNISPGELCMIQVNITKNASAYATAEGEIQVNGKKISSASILFGKIPRNKIDSENFDQVTKEFLRRKKEEGPLS